MHTDRVKGTLAAGALLGVLAIGGLPALAHTMAADEPTAADAADAWQPGDGAPPWSNGHHRGQAEKGQTPRGKTAKGRTHHGAAMREWAHCLAGAEKPSAEWKKVCGPKPTPPGHLKHPRR